MDKLKLEFPSIEREREAFDFLKEFYNTNSEIHGTCGLYRYNDRFAEWVRMVKDNVRCVSNEKRVPSETYFLVRESDDRIIGMVTINLELNRSLWDFGGHIGYSIRPSERKKGYNKVNLYLALLVCAKRGLDVVLLVCSKKNLGSSKTIRALGGRMICEYYNSEKNDIIQNYIIDVKASLSEYRDCISESIGEYPK